MVLLQSEEKLKTGNQAPDFKLKGIDDKDYKLSDFFDKQGTLIIFMCNHCPYVKTKIADMKELQNKFGDQISIVGINSNDPNYKDEGFDNMKSHASEWGLNFAYLIDDTQQVARDYGAVCTPDPFLFDNAGKLIFHGRINNAMSPNEESTENTMENIINKFLNNEEIPQEPMPSQGCSIKWKE